MPLQWITTNLAGTTRRETMGGRDYVVAPMVMLTEGVHNGSAGPLYYPADELRKMPTVWNMKPIVVYHPTRQGEGISACDPAVIDTQGVGVIMNTKFRKGKLTAEAWLELGRVEAVDKRVLVALEEGTMMELSTGLFTENVETEGEWNGKEYVAIARNYRPDHLALLPDKVGACSIKDGAGFLRTNQSGLSESVRAAGAWLGQAEADRLTANEKSYGNISSDLYTLLREKLGATTDAWVQDVYDGFFIYQNGGKLYRLGYATANDKTTLADETPVEVLRVSEYRTADGAFVGNAGPVLNTKESAMDKTKVINGLIANAATPWKEQDRAFLAGLADDQLCKVANLGPDGTPLPPEQPKPQVPEAPAPVVPVPAPAPVANAQPAPVAPAPMTFAQLVANADPATREMLSEMQAEHNAQRAALVTELTANAACPFTAEFLATKPLPELRGMAVLARSARGQAQASNSPQMFRQPNYAGAATPGAAPVGNAAETDLLPPVMNFSKN